MNACAIKERVLLITVAIVLAHMQEALEDNNLILYRNIFSLFLASSLGMDDGSNYSTRLSVIWSISIL